MGAPPVYPSPQALQLLRLFPDIHMRIDVLVLVYPALWDRAHLLTLVLDLDRPVVVPRPASATTAAAALGWAAAQPAALSAASAAGATAAAEAVVAAASRAALAAEAAAAAVAGDVGEPARASTTGGGRTATDSAATTERQAASARPAAPPSPSVPPEPPAPPQGFAPGARRPDLDLPTRVRRTPAHRPTSGHPRQAATTSLPPCTELAVPRLSATAATCHYSCHVPLQLPLVAPGFYCSTTLHGPQAPTPRCGCWSSWRRASGGASWRWRGHRLQPPRASSFGCGSVWWRSCRYGWCRL